MDFSWNDFQKDFRHKVLNFAKKIIEPEAAEYDAKGIFPWATYKKMGEEGFLGLILPQKYGGVNGGALEYSILCEEIAKASPAYIHNGHYQTEKMILHCGTEDQRLNYLPRLATGEYLAATAISEPGVGSSFEGMSSIAQPEGEYYILNGVKIHINDAAEAGIINFFAIAPSGLSVFLIDPKRPGFRIIEKLDPIGLRASPIYSFRLENYRAPKEWLIGEEGKGIEVFFTAFNFSRLGNASCLLGIAKGALEKAIAFAKEKKVGHRLTTEFQGIRWLIAELSTKLEAATLLRDKAAWMEDRGENPVKETSMAKLIAGEISQEIVKQAIQITGSFGCYRNTPFERYWRDAKSLCIAGGTLEVMKNNIARKILG
jgi:alkylation response protein AidB-like acyl-CoA dehydrogenase